MLRNINNCFYCQGLKNFQPQKGGKCSFCGVYNNPLYLIFYKEKGRHYYFCCGCAWWQFPRSEVEKEAENKWFQQRKEAKKLVRAEIWLYQKTIKKKKLCDN